MDDEFLRLLEVVRESAKASQQAAERCLRFCDGLLSPERRTLAAYQLLGAQPSCTDEELKTAYRRKVARWHPDRFFAVDIPQELKNYAAREFARMVEAYSMLREQRSGPRRS